MAEQDIKLRIKFVDENGKEMTKAIQGSWKEIGKTISNIDTNKFGEGLNISTRQALLLTKQLGAVRREAKGLQKLDLTAKTSASELKRDKKGQLRFKKGVRKGGVGVGGRPAGQEARALDKQRQAQLKINEQTQKAIKNNVKLRRTAGSYRRELTKLFSRQRNRIITQQTQNLTKLRTQLVNSKGPTTQLSKKIFMMEDALKQLKTKSIDDIVKSFENLEDVDLEKITQDIDELFAAQKGKFSGIFAGGGRGGGGGGGPGSPGFGITPPRKGGGPKVLAGKKGGFFAGISNIGQALSGAFGFATIEAGIQIQKLFQDKRVSGQIASGAKQLGTTIGSVLGSTVGSIAGDLGNALGALTEVVVNQFTFLGRLAGAAFGAAIRGLGIVFASGAIFGALSGALAAGGAAALAPVGALLASAIVVPLGFALISALNDLVSEVLSIVGNLFKTLVSVATAGIKIIGATLKAGFKIISSIWTAAWKGLKQVVLATWKAVQDITAQGVKITTRLIKDAFKAFVEFETGITKAAKELADKGNQIDRIASQVSGTRIRFGFDQKDSAAAFFDLVSSGLRKTSEQTKIFAAASNLALADQTGLANATNALITVYQTYGEKLSDIDMISRLLSTSTTLGRTSLEELGPALKNVAGIAKFAGVSLESMLVSITALTRVFGRGSTRSVTRFLSRFIEAISNPTSRARKEFEKLGVSVDDLGDGSFNDKFVNLLKTLKGVKPDQLRDFFPTIQSRKAFVGLTGDIDKFIEVQDQIRKNSNIQGKQIQLIFGTLQQRLKQINQLIQVTRERFGSLFAGIIKSTVFSNNFMRIWMMIGNIIASPALTNNIKRWTTFLIQAVAPVANNLLPALRSLRNIIERIAVTNPFRDKEIKDFANNIRSILTITDKWVKSLTGGLTVGMMLEQSFSIISLSAEKVLEVFEKIDSGEITIDTLLEQMKQIRDIAADALLENATKGINKLTRGLGAVTDIIAGLDLGKESKEFLENLSPRQLSVIKSVSLLFRQLGETVRAIFFRIVDDIFQKLVDAFSQSGNVFIKKLREALMLVAKSVGLIEKLLQVTGQIEPAVAFSPEDFSKLKRGEFNDILARERQRPLGPSEINRNIVEFGQGIDDFLKATKFEGGAERQALKQAIFGRRFVGPPSSEVIKATAGSRASQRDLVRLVRAASESRRQQLRRDFGPSAAAAIEDLKKKEDMLIKKLTAGFNRINKAILAVRKERGEASLSEQIESILTDPGAPLRTIGQKRKEDERREEASDDLTRATRDLDNRIENLIAKRVIAGDELDQNKLFQEGKDIILDALKRGREISERRRSIDAISAEGRRRNVKGFGDATAALRAGRGSKELIEKQFAVFKRRNLVAVVKEGEKVLRDTGISYEKALKELNRAMADAGGSLKDRRSILFNLLTQGRGKSKEKANELLKSVFDFSDPDKKKKNQKGSKSNTGAKKNKPEGQELGAVGGGGNPFGLLLGAGVIQKVFDQISKETRTRNFAAAGITEPKTVLPPFPASATDPLLKQTSVTPPELPVNLKPSDGLPITRVTAAAMNRPGANLASGRIRETRRTSAAALARGRAMGGRMPSLKGGFGVITNRERTIRGVSGLRGSLHGRAGEMGTAGIKRTSRFADRFGGSSLNMRGRAIRPSISKPFPEKEASKTNTLLREIRSLIAQQLIASKNDNNKDPNVGNANVNAQNNQGGGPGQPANAGNVSSQTGN